MKKRSTRSAAKPVKQASGAKARVVRAKQRVGSVKTPGKRLEAFDLEVIPIRPTEIDEAPPDSTVDLKRVRFGYFEPDAQEVSVVGSFNNWNPRATPMKRRANGDWAVEVRLPPGEYRYRFLVDGEWRDDPAAQFTAMNLYGSFDAIVIV